MAIYTGTIIHRVLGSWNMLVIWGRTNSVNVQKVVWACEEMAVKYERIDAGLAFGVVNTPEYLALNPNGLVPTIDDDGFVLWESHAIVRYLGSKYGAGSLWPNDLRARADADRWMDWTNSIFWPAIRPLFMGLIRNGPEAGDAPALERSRLKTVAALEIVESHMTSRSFLAGDTFTMGDIALGCAAWRWMALPIERPELPNVKRWFDSLVNRPAYKKVVMLPLT